MIGMWKVYFEDKEAGSCELRHEGLYIRIICRCDITVEGICRLMLKCGERGVDLGVLAPVSGGFGLDRKLPAKSLPQGEPRFYIKIPGKRQLGLFIPVSDGDRFPDLSRLLDARFGCEQGHPGVYLDKN